MKLTPPFGRVGSKASLRDRVYSRFPKNFNTYIEPFIGGGSIFFGYDFGDKKSVINDKDKQLISAYKILKRGVSGDFKKYDTTNLATLNNLMNKKGGTDLDRLIAFRIRSNNTFGGLGTGKVYKTTSPMRLLVKVDKYKEKLKNTTILNQDYKAVINRYDNAGAFFYFDPPYENSDDLYKYDTFNYPEMAEKLKKLKGKFLLSVNDSSAIRNLFKGFKIRGVSVIGGGHGQGVGAGTRKELLISNY